MTGRCLLGLGLVVGLCASWGTAAPPQGHDHDADEMNAHPQDPVLQAEHRNMLRLVPLTAVTHRTVRSGRWSDRATWQDGKLPSADANVLIPRGQTVTLDSEPDLPLRTVRIDGKLTFAPDRDTCLRADTIVVMPLGQLIVGTTEAPIAPERRARIVFTDRGPIDTRWDPTLLSRGLISHGRTSLVGAPVTPFVALARAPRKGDTQLVLARAPVSWKKGDHLIVTGTASGGGKGWQTQDEERIILDIAGAGVTVSALQFDHTVPAAGLSAYVGNLSRNVRLESQNRDPAALGRHGHVMFMHAPRVTIAYTVFHDLGRTDKRVPVDDPRLDDKRVPIAGSGTNPRGRYPVHFHRTGAHVTLPAISVKGCAVVNSPGWGYVNHSSHVDFEDNVAFNVHGAAFVTEAGDEVGSFRRNLAVHSVGSGQDTVARNRLQDFGHEGSGFWLQGGGVAVDDNIAAGQRDAAFFFFTSGLEEDGLGRRGFLVANLPEALRVNNVPSPKEKQPKGRMTINYLPLRSCRGNIAFASGVGILVRFHTPPETESLIENCTVWRTGTGVRILYSDNIRLKSLRLIGDGKNAQMGVAQGSEAIGGTVYEDLHVEGWDTGLAVSDIVARSQRIKGGYYNNRVNIALALPFTRAGDGRADEITGPIRFGPASARDISLAVNHAAFFTRDPNLLFAAHVIRLDTPKYPKKQLYYTDQGADFVPLKNVATGKFRPPARGHVPEELIGKTNEELWQKYGLALAGTVAPADAAAVPRIDGLVGSPTTAQPALTLYNVYSPKLEDYHPLYSAPGQRTKPSAEADAVSLRRGWNLVTRKVKGDVRSFLVFGGASRPSYAKKAGVYPEQEKPRPPKGLQK